MTKTNCQCPTQARSPNSHIAHMSQFIVYAPTSKNVWQREPPKTYQYTHLQKVINAPYKKSLASCSAASPKPKTHHIKHGCINLNSNLKHKPTAHTTQKQTSTINSTWKTNQLHANKSTQTQKQEKHFDTETRRHHVVSIEPLTETSPSMLKILPQMLKPIESAGGWYKTSFNHKHHQRLL